MTLSKIAKELDVGRITATELCQSSMVMIEDMNGALGGFSDTIFEQAISAAKASDTRRIEGHCLGPLDGIPIAVKDIIDTVPARCSAGLEHLKNFQPQSDADVVRSLKSAGAVILGVTETDPGAFSTDTPKVMNPVALDRSAGGSSGGSGVVVASGMCFAALGTDTGGSVRIPAACCNICGFKPTQGRLSLTGIRPLANSLDHVGPMARSVRDLRLVFDALAEANASGEVAKIKKIGIARTYFADADPSVQRAMGHVSSRLGKAGIQIMDVGLPAPNHVLNFHMVSALYEAASYHDTEFPEQWRNYPAVAKQSIEAGLKVSQAIYQNALLARRSARAVVDQALNDIDAIIVPTLPIDAPFRGQENCTLAGIDQTVLGATIRYTALFNQGGHPVVAMPGAVMPDGRAVGIQIVGKRGGDQALLALAERLEGLLEAHVDLEGLMLRECGTRPWKSLRV